MRSMHLRTSGVAQWLACWAHNPKVRGSKPRSAILCGIGCVSSQWYPSNMVSFHKRNRVMSSALHEPRRCMYNTIQDVALRVRTFSRATYENDPGRTRTCNPRLRRPMPYPLGHGASCANLTYSTSIKLSSLSTKYWNLFIFSRYMKDLELQLPVYNG